MSSLAIATNIMGINSHRMLKVVTGKSELSSERLSSGFKINKSGDDSAGLAISEKMRNQIAGLNKASKNIEDGVSLIAIADAGMSEISDMLKRQRELVIQGMNDTNSDADRAKIDVELKNLTTEINEAAYSVNYNTLNLLAVKTGANVFLGEITSEIIDNTVDPPRQTIDISGDVPSGVPRRVVTVASFTVNEGDSFSVWLKDLSPNRHYPDLRIVAPNGVMFGCPINSSETGIGDSGYVITPSTPLPPGTAEYMSYNGCSADGGPGGERFNVTNAAETGIWTIEFLLDTSSGGIADQFVVEVSSSLITPDNLWIQTGANKTQGLNVDRYNCTAGALGVVNLSVANFGSGEESLKRIDKAIDLMSKNRAIAGAQFNRLEHVLKSVDIASVNLIASESRIRDADMAKEMMEFTKSNILQQAGISMLSQANQSPQNVINLLR